MATVPRVPNDWLAMTTAQAESFFPANRLPNERE